MFQSHLKIEHNGVQITVRIHSRLPRKTRRAVLLSLFRAVKEDLKHVYIHNLYHSDEPLGTALTNMMREVVGNDALYRRQGSGELGYAIRILRTKAKLSQSTLAKRLGVSQSLLSRLEHGKRMPEESSRPLISYHHCPKAFFEANPGLDLSFIKPTSAKRFAK
jgi:DNA-binding transcriptional regulator YiaG